MTRYLILDDDRTTADGMVHAQAAPFVLDGRHIAREDDDVICPACNTTGKVRCVGARLPMTGPDGRRVALSDDLCICECTPAPKLVASQRVKAVEA
jgi:uncharacterized Zn-binding protein involved in type VI secretion